MHTRIYKAFLGALVTASTTLLGCSETTTLGHFDVDQDLPEIQVQGSLVSALLPTEFAPIPLNVKSEEAFQNANYDYLTTIEVDSLTLRITEKSNDPAQDSGEDGQPDNFDFFKSVSVFIRATINGEERRELIAELPEGSDELSAGQSQIQFIMSGLDILPFVEAEGGYEVITEATGTPPSDDVYFDGEAVYRVGIGFR